MVERLSNAFALLGGFAFVGVAALATTLPPARDTTVTTDAAGLVTVVDEGSPAWSSGIRPGWKIVAITAAETMYSDGTNVSFVVDDPLGEQPLARLFPSVGALVLAGLALVLSLRRVTLALVIVAAGFATPVYLARLSGLGLVMATLPAIAASWLTLGVIDEVWPPQNSRMRALLLVLLGPAAFIAVWLWTRDQGAAALVPLAYLTCAWLLFAVSCVREVVSSHPEETSKLTLVRSVVMELSPFAGRLRVVAAQTERDRLAGELHAEVLPAITSTVATLEQDGETAAASRLRDLEEEIRDLVSARRLPLLEDEGLVAAAEWIAESTEEHTSLRVEIDLTHDSGARPPLPVERAAYRVLQLAVDNAIRHSGASTIRIAIASSRQVLSLAVADDGAGMPLDAASAALSHGHLGFVDMRAQADSVGASLQIMPGTGAGAPLTGHPPEHEAMVGVHVRFRWVA